VLYAEGYLPSILSRFPSAAAWLLLGRHASLLVADPVNVLFYGLDRESKFWRMAEVAIPRNLFADILRLIAELRPPPAAAST
jgi:hypothetical protein